MLGMGQDSHLIWSWSRPFTRASTSLPSQRGSRELPDFILYASTVQSYIFQPNRLCLWTIIIAFLVIGFICVLYNSGFSQMKKKGCSIQFCTMFSALSDHMIFLIIFPILWVCTNSLSAAMNKNYIKYDVIELNAYFICTCKLNALLRSQSWLCRSKP